MLLDGRLKSTPPGSFGRCRWALSGELRRGRVQRLARYRCLLLRAAAALFADSDGDFDGGAYEAELLAEAAFDEAAVAGL